MDQFPTEIARDVRALRVPSEPFDFEAPPVDPLELKEHLERVMNEKRGIGLSAPQLGINFRVFAIAAGPDATIFNPRIVDRSEQEIELEEGCLSFPGLLVKVKRPRIIKVRFQVADGEVRTLKLDGMTARIFQHEIDHLDGRLFFDGLSRLKIDMAVRKAAKSGNAYRTGELVWQP